MNNARRFNPSASVAAYVLVFIFLQACSFGEARVSNADNAGENPETAAYNKGLLWKITNDDNEPGYLFGTMHSEDKRVLSLPPAAKTAFENADSLTLEIFPDVSASVTASEYIYYKDGRTLEQVIGKSLFKRTVLALRKYEIPATKIVTMKPWMVFGILSLPKPETGIFLDRLLYQKARKNNKQLYSLESVSEQLTLFDTMPEKDQIILLKYAVNNIDHLETWIEEMTKAYLAGDLQQLQSIGIQYLPEEDEVASAFNERLIDRRNITMVERMLPRLNAGNAFIAIGALHLPGKHGVLKLLEQKGYQLDRVGR